MDKIVSSRSLHDVLGFVYSLALTGLGLLGMVGIVYHTLGPDGWFAAWLGRLWSRNPGGTLLLLVGAAAVMLMVHRRAGRERLARGHTELPLYFFVALGALFAARALIYGRF